MSGFVVDASITAAWVLPDEFHPRAEALKQRLNAEDAHVPAVWPAEVANALLMAERRRRVSAEDVQAALADLRGPGIVIDEADRDRTWTDTIRLAREHRLTVYDAAYLELASRLSLPLATSDKRLGEAAERAGAALL